MTLKAWNAGTHNTKSVCCISELHKTEGFLAAKHHLDPNDICCIVLLSKILACITQSNVTFV